MNADDPSLPAVLHLTRDLPPARQGGLSVAVAALVEGLAASGARQAVASFDGWRPARAGAAARAVHRERDGRWPVWRLEGPDQLAGLTAEAEAWLAASTTSILCIHSDLLADLGLELAGRCGAQAVLVAHVLQGPQRRLHGAAAANASELAQLRALDAVDAVIAPSAFAAAALQAEAAAAGRRWPRCFVAPPPRPPSTLSGPGRAAWPTAAEDVSPLRALYVGRFDAIKGLDVLLAAIERLPAETPRHRWMFAGGLPHHPRGERRWRSKLEAAAPAGSAALSLAPLLPGFLDHRDALATIAAADVVAVPSRLETFGQVAAEAMAAGRCLVASDAGALGARLHHGVDALVVPAGDAATLAAALSAALCDAGLRQRLGAAAQAAAQRSADPLAAWLDALRQLALSGRRQ